MATKKILLLNPPGDKIYFRDYYCSKASKANYYYHPVDLLYLSGRFKKPEFDLHIIDAIADKLNENVCLTDIKQITPDIILTLVGSPSYKKDLAFLNKIKKEIPTTILIASGDVYRELKQEAFINADFLDAILMDFSTDDIIKYILGDQEQKINNVIYKYKGEIIIGEENHSNGEFNVPVPSWELFHLEKYSFPFARRKKFASILTDFGCAYNCSFCPISSLGFKLRPVNSVIEELKLLQTMGVKELFIRDQTFGANKKRTIDLCETIINQNFDFSWTCFSRVDVVDEKMMILFKNAGCHTIMFGIESASEETLANYKKNITIEKIRQTLNICKKFKIRTVGTFIIGLPGETKGAILATIKLAKTLPLDFASFNIAAPLPGSTFRQEAVKKGLTDKDNLEMENSKGLPVWKNRELTNEEILQLSKWAVKSFYLRPSYIFKRLISIKTFEEVKRAFTELTSLFQ